SKISARRLLRKPFRASLCKRNWTAPRACKLLLLFAENDPRFGQIIRRKLYRNFVSRNNADEMFTHLARNMGKNIPLSGKIDAKHRARQHLRYRALGHDLFLFRPETKCPSAAKIQPNAR